MFDLFHDPETLNGALVISCNHLLILGSKYSVMFGKNYLHFFGVVFTDKFSLCRSWLILDNWIKDNSSKYSIHLLHILRFISSAYKQICPNPPNLASRWDSKWIAVDQGWAFVGRRILEWIYYTRLLIKTDYVINLLKSFSICQIRTKPYKIPPLNI